MRKQDSTFVFFSLATMALGVFLPFVSAYLQWVPTVGMLTILFVSFLAVDGRDVWQNLRHYPGAVLLLAVMKLIVMPVLCWAIVRAILPEYALSAALAGGVATGVAAPFFAYLAGADIVLVLVGLVTTNLLLPFVLPMVLAFLDSQGGLNLDLPVTDMVIKLAVMTGVPFTAAQILRRVRLSLAEKILGRRTLMVTTCVGFCNIAIFSRYSSLFFQAPGRVLEATGVAIVLFCVLFSVSAALTWRFPPRKQLAFVISCVAINNVLALIISIEFFSTNEALIAALYSLPFFLAVYCYKLLAHIRGYHPE